MLIAQQLRLGSDCADDCYSLGLFHNAGMSLIHAQFPDYAKVLKVGLSQQLPFVSIEQRYFPTETKAGTNEQLPIQSRLRYQLQFSQKFGKHSLLKISDEIMFHAGGWVDHLRMDQNRVYLAARTQFTPSLALEAGYLWIINQGIETTSPVRETDVLRFTLHHSLASKKK